LEWVPGACSSICAAHFIGVRSCVYCSWGPVFLASLPPVLPGAKQLASVLAIALVYFSIMGVVAKVCSGFVGATGDIGVIVCED